MTKKKEEKNPKDSMAKVVAWVQATVLTEGELQPGGGWITVDVRGYAVLPGDKCYPFSAGELKVSGVRSWKLDFSPHIFISCSTLY